MQLGQSLDIIDILEVNIVTVDSKDSKGSQILDKAAKRKEVPSTNDCGETGCLRIHE